ncbi:MAG: 30S ribosomal protein S5 [Puniceicoccales bacterium]|jgi:small subunit ribosomal protein S5|nr:30S ribosomal protein S5 [Puniceicoccales bacterium]
MSDSKRTERGQGGFRRRRDSSAAAFARPDRDELKEKVVHVNRCAKVVKGGRRFGFAALVVVGDQKGRIGVGYGKAKEVPEAIRKGTEHAKKNMSSFQLRETTVPHVAIGVSDGGRVLLRPAAPGTGIIAGGGVRAVLEILGVKDVLTKSMRSKNQFAVVNATMDALRKMRTHAVIKQLRTAEGDELCNMGFDR